MADNAPILENPNGHPVTPDLMTAETVDLARYYRLDELEAMPADALEELWRACPDKGFYEQALEEAVRMRFGSHGVIDDLQRLEVIHQSIGYYVGNPPRIPLSTGWFKVPRRVLRHLETGAPLIQEKAAEAKRQIPVQVMGAAAVGLVLFLCLAVSLIRHATRQNQIGEADLTATASSEAALALLPDQTTTPTPLALDDIDRPIKAGDDVREYYPVILEIQPASAPARVFPVQQKEVEIAQWVYADDPDVASAVLGLVIRPVLGIPYTPENASFLEGLQAGDAITLKMSTGSSLLFTVASLSRIDRQDTSIFNQSAPGLVIALLGDPAGDRLVIYGSYPAGQEHVSAAQEIANGETAAEVGQPIQHGESGLTAAVLEAYTSAGPLGAELPEQWAYLLIDLHLQAQTAVDMGAFQMEVIAPDGGRYAPVTVDSSITNLAPYIPHQMQVGEDVRATVGFLIPRALTSGILTFRVSSESPAVHTQLDFNPPATLSAADLDVLILGMEAQGTPDNPGDLVVRARLFNPFQQPITIRPGEVFAIFSPVVLEDTFPVGPAVQPASSDLPMVLNRGEAADIEFRFRWTGEPFVGLQVGGYQFIATLFEGG